MTEPKNPSRCANRTSRIAWCKTLQKPCTPPQEYSHCQNYQPKQNTQPISKESQAITEKSTPEKFLLGTKTGKCDICKATKKILLLNYGFNLCEECISICTAILEQLPIDDVTLPPQKAGADKQKTASLKQLNLA
jgi:hypothetical protein